jgi:hypothetical protein
MTKTKRNLIIFIIVTLASGWLGVFLDNVLTEQPDSAFVSMSRITFTLIAILTMVCWSVMFVELYRLTKSVWPGVIMHVVEDALPTLLVIEGYLVFTKTGDILFNPTTGIITTILFLGVGFAFRTIRIKRTITKI